MYQLNIQSNARLDNMTPLQKIEVLTSMKLTHILLSENLAETMGSAKKLIEQGGIKVNGEVVKDINYVIQEDQRVRDKRIMIEKGKREIRIAERIPIMTIPR